MGYQIGVLLLVAGCVSVTFALPTCVCTRRFKPVCGSDGKTYSNECLLKCAASEDSSITLQRQAPCESTRAKRAYLICACPANIDPVCGTNGETYSNECILNCENDPNLHVAHRGPCRTKRASVPCVCTYEFSPICGTDGQTYSNECALKCEKKRSGVEVKHRGACKVKREDINIAPGPICLCTADINPVCGTNGLTYSNPCLLNCAKDNSQSLDLLHEGECEAKPVYIGETDPSVSSCTCGRDRNPVCASNGVTYANECLMECVGKELSVVHGGPCNA